MAKNKKQDPAVLKLDVDNQCPNCGHFSYKAEDNNDGCTPYFTILIGNMIFWALLDWISLGLLDLKYHDEIGFLAVCSLIVLIIFKKKMFKTKKSGEFIEFTCNNCNYKDNLKLL